MIHRDKKVIVQELIKNFPNLEIRYSPIELAVYSKDAGFYEIEPICVVFVKNEIDVKELIQFCYQNSYPLLFRAGGTSLSGQTLGNCVIIDISRGFKNVEFLKDNQVRVGPGITGGYVNQVLKKYKQKIGPDPSSLHAAMIGGIVANNASGMCCGTQKNAYHTLKHIRWILPNGNSYSTEIAKDYERFVKQEEKICHEIEEIKKIIHSNTMLLEKIRSKYKIKNTMGYSMNSFLDYEHPMDIFSHLLVGSEGTLGFIAEVVLETFDDFPFKATSFLVFKNIYDASTLVPILIECEAEAVELMDKASLKAISKKYNIEAILPEPIDTQTALLCEFQAQSKQVLNEKIKKAYEKIYESNLVINNISFITDEHEQLKLWRIRKGLFPIVGSDRERGTSVVLEDVAFPLHNLAEGVEKLHYLFKKYSYTNAIIFGHAKDGNLHFVITPNFNNTHEVDNYQQFMNELAEMVINLQGSLKAEHGTGRNMAPFVEREWGSELYNLMKKLKQAVDPKNIFNPGVIINEDATVHLKNLKKIPAVDMIVDQCIECGFCEVSCPSNHLTLSPRKRIQLKRTLQNDNDLKKKINLSELNYQFSATCAVDGLCALYCPVEINTGELVKKVRNLNYSKIEHAIASFVARNFLTTEKILRFYFKYFPNSLHKRILSTIPHNFNANFHSLNDKNIHSKEPNEFIFFSTCASRLMHTQMFHDSFWIKKIGQKIGIKIMCIDSNGFCCGQSFASKGFFDQANYITEKLFIYLSKNVNLDKTTLIFDTTSCVNYLSGLPLFKGLQIMDSIDFLNDVVLKKCKDKLNKYKFVFYHPVCSAYKLKKVEKSIKLLEVISENLFLPDEVTCCAMAGDRGFFFPELSSSSTYDEKQYIKKLSNETLFCSSSPTCNINLSYQTEKNFVSLIELFYKALK
jgi:D-lactate dehydrogenase